ncbi:MAG: IS630 family transposase [Bacteroidota bacterium]
MREHIVKTSRSFVDYNLYFQDESRFGLFTRNGKALTAKGIKPVCPYQHKYENLYLFGAFSPITGSTVMLELPFCNTDMFQQFLDELSKHQPKEYKIVVLDNGAFHKANRLVIPPNIGLLFLPPYSPELNPAEQVWRIIKKEMTNQVYHSLDELSEAMKTIIQNKITNQAIINLTGYPFYLDAYQTIYDL